MSRGVPAERMLSMKQKLSTSDKSSNSTNGLLKVDLLQPKHLQTKTSPVNLRDRATETTPNRNRKQGVCDGPEGR